MKAAEQLLQEGFFSYIDIAFAEMLLKSTSLATEEVHLAISYLLNLSRQGHLAIDSRETPCLPLGHQKYQAMILKGFQNLPYSLVTQLAPDCRQGVPFTPICQQGHYYYLQKSWLEETLFLEHYLRVVSAPPAIAINSEEIEKKLADYVSRKILTTEQAQVIRQACTHSFLLLIGGPGVGKTYTAGHLISIIWESLSPQQKQDWKMAVAAPTGKAAANLQKSLQRAVPDLKTFTATTLHQLLNIKNTEHLHPLSADLILVDESSMIDSKIMSKLFSLIKPGARLVLVGDPHQLPPVESGGLFNDLVEVSPFSAALHTCLRTDRQDLLQLAAKIKTGQVNETIQLLESSASIK